MSIHGFPGYYRRERHISAPVMAGLHSLRAVCSKKKSVVSLFYGNSFLIVSHFQTKSIELTTLADVNCKKGAVRHQSSSENLCTGSGLYGNAKGKRYPCPHGFPPAILCRYDVTAQQPGFYPPLTVPVTLPNTAFLFSFSFPSAAPPAQVFQREPADTHPAGLLPSHMCMTCNTFRTGSNSRSACI